jgi:CelD/BcsL family acetyltransferase involved in cellulose biosynthesis
VRAEGEAAWSPEAAAYGGAQAPPSRLEDVAGNVENWLEFIRSHPSATVFHHPAWLQLLADCYGYSRVILTLADDRERPRAGLPLLATTGFLGRRRLVALPFTDHCPLLATDASSASTFTHALARWSSARGPIEVRGDLPDSGVGHAAVSAVRHVLELPPDPEQLRSGFRKQLRYDIAKSARQRDLRLVVGAGERALADFYRLHVRTRRRLGVPVQPRRFFELVWSRILQAGLGHAAVLYHQEEPIAGSVFLTWNRTVVYKYSASEPSHWLRAPNILILWAAIRRACEEGYTSFDFGRSDSENRGLREFKSHWGAREMPLTVWHFGETVRPRTEGLAQRALRTVIQRSPELVCRATGQLLYRYFP